MWAEEGTAAGAGDVASSSPGYNQNKIQMIRTLCFAFSHEAALNYESLFKEIYKIIFFGMKLEITFNQN